MSPVNLGIWMMTGFAIGAGYAAGSAFACWLGKFLRRGSNG